MGREKLCLKCGYRWLARVPSPTWCPKCHRLIDGHPPLLTLDQQAKALAQFNADQNGRVEKRRVAEEKLIEDQLRQKRQEAE